MLRSHPAFEVVQTCCPQLPTHSASVIHDLFITEGATEMVDARRSELSEVRKMSTPFVSLLYPLPCVICVMDHPFPPHHCRPLRSLGAGAGSPDWGVGPPRGGHQPQMAYDEPRRDSRDSLSRLSREEARGAKPVKNSNLQSMETLDLFHLTSIQFARLTDTKQSEPRRCKMMLVMQTNNLL